jgi:hypothetical protein
MSTVADITRNTRTACIIPGLDLHIDVADVIVNMPVGCIVSAAWPSH